MSHKSKSKSKTKPIIQTKILSECKSTNDVLITTAIFKMKDSYRSFEKYEYQLYTLIKNIPSFANLRIYVDDSTEYLFEKYNKTSQPNIEFIYYKCVPFLTDDEKFHDGTFGSIVRLLPCFDFPTGYKYVCVSDIDVSPKMNFQKKFFDKMIDEKAQISYHSALCYTKPWIKIEYPIVNLRFITTVQFPKRLLTTFLQNILDKKYESDRKKILEYDLKAGKKFNPDTKFPYGFDELFTNDLLAKYIFPRFKCLIYRFVTLGTIFKSCFYSTYKTNKKIESLVLKHWNECEKVLWTEPFVPNKIMKMNYDMTIELFELMKDCDKMKMCIESFIDAFKHSEKNSPYHIFIQNPTKNYTTHKTRKNKRI